MTSLSLHRIQCRKVLSVESFVLDLGRKRVITYQSGRIMNAWNPFCELLLESIKKLSGSLCQSFVF